MASWFRSHVVVCLLLLTAGQPYNKVTTRTDGSTETIEAEDNGNHIKPTTVDCAHDVTTFNNGLGETSSKDVNMGSETRLG